MLMPDLIEIEVHSFCNRHCKWCPNSIKDRGLNFMPEPMYLRLLENLKEFHYEGMISYSRYNEPMANEVIYKRLEQARTALPEVWKHLNTNGDFITKTTLDILALYLSSLSIQMYDIKNPYPAITKWRINWRGMLVEIRWPKLIVNRMRIIKPYRRIIPCNIPKRNCYIDWNGSVMPCCNMRSDFHPNFILGNLQDSDSIFNIWPMKHEIDITKEPCLYCCYGDIEE